MLTLGRQVLNVKLEEQFKILTFTTSHCAFLLFVLCGYHIYLMAALWCR